MMTMMQRDSKSMMMVEVMGGMKRMTMKEKKNGQDMENNKEDIIGEFFNFPQEDFLRVIDDFLL